MNPTGMELEKCVLCDGTKHTTAGIMDAIGWVCFDCLSAQAIILEQDLGLR